MSFTFGLGPPPCIAGRGRHTSRCMPKCTARPGLSTTPQELQKDRTKEIFQGLLADYVPGQTTKRLSCPIHEIDIGSDKENKLKGGIPEIRPGAAALPLLSVEPWHELQNEEELDKRLPATALPPKEEIETNFRSPFYRMRIAKVYEKHVEERYGKASAEVSSAEDVSTEQALEKSPHWKSILALLLYLCSAYKLKIRAQSTVKGFGAQDSEAAKAAGKTLKAMGIKRATVSSTTSRTGYVVYDPQADMPNTRDGQPPKIDRAQLVIELKHPTTCKISNKVHREQDYLEGCDDFFVWEQHALFRAICSGTATTAQVHQFEADVHKIFGSLPVQHEYAYLGGPDCDDESQNLLDARKQLLKEIGQRSSLYQVLSQAVCARAPYSLLTDGALFMFFMIQPRMLHGKVVGWDLRYCAKSYLSDGPSVYQILHRLIRGDDLPDSDWPTADQMFIDRHPGFPVPNEQLQLLVWKGEGQSGTATASMSENPDVPQSVTLENIGEPIGVGLHGGVFEFVVPGSQKPSGLVIKVAHRAGMMGEMAFSNEMEAYKRCQKMGFTGLPAGPLPRFYGGGELPDGKMYIVLERVDGIPGCDLHPDEVEDVWEKVMLDWQGLSMFCGVMHQDLRWENVVYNRTNGYVYLFDLAQVVFDKRGSPEEEWENHAGEWKRAKQDGILQLQEMMD